MASAFRARARTLHEPEHQPSLATRTSLIAIMVIGSLTMWIANPALWLWITAHLQHGTQARMGPYGIMLLGIVLTCVALGKGISVVHRHYEHITGRTPQIRVILPWRRSLRGGRSQAKDTDGRLPLNALDVIMTLSVMLAVVSFTTWYVVSSPAPPSAGGTGPHKR